MKAIEIAKYFIYKSNQEQDLISNMKLQKLLYYSQGLYLATTGNPLFNENVFAWTHGPVVEDVYHKYKVYNSNSIPCEDINIVENISSDIKEFLDEIYNIFGQYSASILRNMSHNEKPWLETEPGEIIDQDKMKEFFKDKLIK